MINHHHSDLLFKGNSAIPLNPAALNWVFQPRFRHVDVASLIPLLCSRFGSGSYSKVVSTLVNVCSPFSGFSTGYNLNPPQRACPLGSHLLFTFAIKYDLSYDIDSLQVNTTSIRSTIWGSGKDDRKFITIGISSVEASNLGLIHVQQNEINYLYRLVGIIFRSIFMHYTAGAFDQLKRHTDVHPTVKDPYYYKDKFLLMPLTGIVRYPYWSWRYNLKIWQRSPNLIPYKEVTPEHMLYYFLFISESPAIKAVTSDDGQARILGLNDNTGIRATLVKSLMAFTQYLSNPSDYQFELLDLVAANVLASLLYSGKSRIVLNRSTYHADLVSNTVALAEQLSKTLDHADLVQVLQPYTDVALSLIMGDKRLSNKIFSGMTV